MHFVPTDDDPIWVKCKLCMEQDRMDVYVMNRYDEKGIRKHVMDFHRDYFLPYSPPRFQGVSYKRESPPGTNSVARILADTVKAMPIHVSQPAIGSAIEAMRYSQEATSHKRVGACVVAYDRNGFEGHFSGCNIELSTSNVYHAEVVAMTRAIAAGYYKIKQVVVTSLEEEQQAALCASCLQAFSYANMDCEIVVVRPDGSVKIMTNVRERQGIYGYYGKGKLYDSYRP